MVKYLLLICRDPAIELSPQDRAAMPGWVMTWVDEMTERGVLRPGHELRPVSDATTVRVRGSEVLVADGPFAETKEQIGGFDLLECADLREAVEVAASHPVARFGSVEVRPLQAG